MDRISRKKKLRLLNSKINIENIYLYKNTLSTLAIIGKKDWVLNYSKNGLTIFSKQQMLIE